MAKKVKQTLPGNEKNQFAAFLKKFRTSYETELTKLQGLTR